jgi:hypothetical protein
MCISNICRPTRPTTSSHADASLMNLLNRKTHNNAMDMGYLLSSFDMSALEPAPMAEPASLSASSSSSSSTTPPPHQPQHVHCQAPLSAAASAPIIIIHHHYKDHSKDSWSLQRVTMPLFRGSPMGDALWYINPKSLWHYFLDISNCPNLRCFNLN